MIEVTGIDHIYIAVSDLAVSEQFYDLVLAQALGFRKNAFARRFLWRPGTID
jgi:glyoxylase I family protein